MRSSLVIPIRRSAERDLAIAIDVSDRSEKRIARVRSLVVLRRLWMTTSTLGDRMCAIESPCVELACIEKDLAAYYRHETARAQNTGLGDFHDVIGENR